MAPSWSATLPHKIREECPLTGINRDHFPYADLSIPNESAYLQCVINLRIADDSG